MADPDDKNIKINPDNLKPRFVREGLEDKKNVEERNKSEYEALKRELDKIASEIEEFDSTHTSVSKKFNKNKPGTQGL